MPPTEDKHARTEDPTPKRKKKARDEGQVARSPDVFGWAASLLGSFLLPWYFGIAEHHVLGVTAETANVMAAPSVAGATTALGQGLEAVVEVVAPLGAIFVLLALVTNFVQVGRGFSLKAARPKVSRISPMTGFRRLFSPATAVQAAKQLLKLVVLIFAGYEVLFRLIRSAAGAQPVSLGPILAATASSILEFVRLISLIGLVIGVGDYLYQRQRLKQNLKMTKHEVKEERKSSEGDPEIRRQVLRRGYRIARSRMLAATRTADVVVTNPTHFAVALQYQPGSGAAPRVVAKGVDTLAVRIKEEAATYRVPVVEDPPLARYLFAICEVDQQIPGEIYLAVARLLAFVYALPEMVRGVGVHHHAHSSLPTESEVISLLRSGYRDRAEEILAGDIAV